MLAIRNVMYIFSQHLRGAGLISPFKAYAETPIGEGMPPSSNYHSKVTIRGAENTTTMKPESSSRRRCSIEAGSSQKKDDESDSEDLAPTPKRRRVNGKVHPKPEYNVNIREADVKQEDFIFEEGSSDDDGCSEDEDNQDKMFSSAIQKKKKFYVVENDGRPAELYRTDFIHRLRAGEDIDADEVDQNDNNGLVRLTDRWREEWNHGVQVPLNAKQLPKFVTALNNFPEYRSNTGFAMPKKYLRVKPCSSGDPDATHYEPLPTKRLYQGDRLDEIWLERLNQVRQASDIREIAMKAFLELMNCFEVTCYEAIHQMILAPLNSPDRKDEIDDPPCDVCRKADPEEDDEMIFCDGCNVCVHQSCYGLSELPHGDWFCMKCTICGPDFNPPCLLCPTIGGAYKRTTKIDDTYRWTHISCALWLPECRFDDVERREPVTAIDEIPDERWQLKCSICDTRQGACIQCSVSSCRTPFHVSCAFRSDLEMRIDQDPDPNVDTVLFISLCPKHRSADPSELVPSTSLSLASESSTDDRDNAKVRGYEANFYLYVDSEEVFDKLNQNFDMGVISDVFEYWKLKRSENKGRSLIRNPQDEILLNTADVLSLPSYGAATALSKWKNSIGRMRESLDMGRLLIDMTLKLCRTKRDMTAFDFAVIDNIWSQSTQLAIGQRVNDSLIASLKSIHNTTEAETDSIEMKQWIDSLSAGASIPASRESTPISHQGSSARKVKKSEKIAAKWQSRREVTPLTVLDQSLESPGPSLRSGRFLDTSPSSSKENIRAKVLSHSPERAPPESTENHSGEIDCSSKKLRRNKLQMKSIENVSKIVRLARRLNSGHEKDIKQLIMPRAASVLRSPLPGLILSVKRSKTTLRRSTRLSL